MSPTTELRAGAARADMTPPAGTPLCGGWWPVAAKGIKTPLQAHALVLDNGAARLAFVGLDLIAIRAKDADAAKARIEKKLGIPRENILASCSHIHDGPYMAPLMGKVDCIRPEVVARVMDAIVEAVTEACGRMVPAEVGWGATEVRGYGENRRRFVGDGEDVWNTWCLPVEMAATRPAGPVDDALPLLAVRDRRTHRPLALLWNYTLHAHSFWSGHISADYPYYTWQEVAKALGEDVVMVFTAGACGDINRDSGTDAGAMVRDMGRAILDLYGRLEFTSKAALRGRIEPMELALRDFSVFQEAEIRRKQPEVVEVAREEWEVLRAWKEKTVRTTVHAMAVGDFAVAGSPGEYFCALGLDIKKRSPFAVTAVAELSDDYVGYIPTDRAFDQGGYEVWNLRSSKVARGSGEKIADKLAEMLRAIHKAR